MNLVQGRVIVVTRAQADINNKTGQSKMAKPLDKNYCDTCDGKSTCVEICPKVERDLARITCENIATIRTKENKRIKFKFIDYDHELFGDNRKNYREIMGGEDYYT